jgi:Fur family ferric uptake transcriptional regulator
LEESDIVRSLSFGSQGKKYELGAKEHHDHMICTKCGKIIEFVDEEIEKRQQKIAKDFGFKMQDHSCKYLAYAKTAKLKTKIKQNKGSKIAIIK